MSLDIPESGLDELPNMETDYDGDGENDYEIIPVSNGEAVLPDIIPPETKMELSGKGGDNGWYLGNVSITLSAEDNFGGSGIERIAYSLDNGTLWQDYSGPVEIPEEGIANLQYFSTDKVGNKEAMKTGAIKIDKTAPEAKIIFNRNSQETDIIGMDNLSSNVSVSTEEWAIDSNSKPKTKSIFSWIYDIIGKKEKRKNVLVTLTDEAGHKTEVSFEKRENNEHRVDVLPRSILYDGIKNEFSRSLLQYKWFLDWKKKKYPLFGSHIKTEETALESHYFPKKDETWIMERPKELDDDDNDDDVEKRPVWKKISGMIIPYIQTEKGKINAGY